MYNTVWYYFPLKFQVKYDKFSYLLTTLLTLTVGQSNRGWWNWPLGSFYTIAIPAWQTRPSHSQNPSGGSSISGLDEVVQLQVHKQNNFFLPSRFARWRGRRPPMAITNGMERRAGDKWFAMYWKILRIEGKSKIACRVPRWINLGWSPDW